MNMHGRKWETMSIVIGLMTLALVLSVFPLSASTAMAQPPSIELTIPEIQGSGQFSPYEGSFVETSGTVTLITANGRDAWIQDPSGDGDPTTSDGILIDDFNTLSPPPQVGDQITVRGDVEEQQFGNALPLTRIDNTILVSIDSTGNPLPDPSPLINLPNRVIAHGIAFWEPLEGMLVSIMNGRVVAPTNRFGEFTMLTRRDARPVGGVGPLEYVTREQLDQAFQVNFYGMVLTTRALLPLLHRAQGRIVSIGGGGAACLGFPLMGGATARHDRCASR
jgi:hypothetical protein